MLLAPPHSSTSRWPQASHIAFPASHGSQQPQPLTSVAAGKQRSPPVGLAKRKRSCAAYEAEEEEASTCQDDVQIVKRSRFIPLPQQSTSIITPPRPCLTSPAAYSCSAAGTSVAAPPASAWVRVSTPFGAKYERAEDVKREAYHNGNSSTDMSMDMDCDMATTSYSAPATPPATPCSADAANVAESNDGTLWASIEGDVEMQPDVHSSMPAPALSSPQGTSPPPAWLRLQVTSAAHPHPYATPKPSPSPGGLDASYFPPPCTYDVAQRAHMGAGYFGRAV